MKRVLKNTNLFLIILLLTFSTVAKSDVIRPNTGQESHEVVTGDTLWDISDTFYINPFLWPVLWSRNPEIRNPHLIYPEDNINLMPLKKKKRTIEKVVIKEVVREVIVEEIVVEEVIEIVEAPPVPPKEPTVADLVDTNVLASAGYLASTRPETLGTLTGGLEGRILLEKGSFAYINKGSADGLNVGDEYTIVSIVKGKTSADLPTNGYIVNIHGDCVVSEVLSEDQSIVKVTEDYAEIDRGDVLIPSFRIDGSAKISNDVPDIEDMKVVAAKENGIIMGEKNIVYLNKGSDAGLKAGHELSVFRKEYMSKHPNNGRNQTNFPQEKVGVITVIYTTNDTATAVVAISQKNVLVYDRAILIADRVRKSGKEIVKR